MPKPNSPSYSADMIGFEQVLRMLSPLGEAYKATIKVILIGDPAVGKTSLVKRYVTGQFSKEYLATIGIDLYSLTEEMEIEGKKVLVAWQIWDLAGHPMWYEVRSTAYAGSHCAIIVYDVSRRETFEHVLNWVEEFVKYAGKRPAVLIANKVDLRRKVKTVWKREGLRMRKKLESILGHPVEYIETSALTGYNVKEAFKKVAKLVISEAFRAIEGKS